MTIIEALVQLRNDLKLWVTNNLRVKVDKEDGKGLSSNDYTTEEKEKLAGIEDQISNAISAIDYPVDSVNGKTGVVSLTASDVNALSANDVIDNLLSDSTTQPLSAAQGKALKTAIDSISGDIGDLGGGDMMKATYDTNGNGIVDNAEKLDGHAADYFATAEHTHDNYLEASDIADKADKSYVDDKFAEAKTDASNKDVAVLAEAQNAINDLKTYVDDEIGGISYNSLGTVPVANGGTGADNAKDALTNLGITYGATLPDSGEEGNIFLLEQEDIYRTYETTATIGGIDVNVNFVRSGNVVTMTLYKVLTSTATAEQSGLLLPIPEGFYPASQQVTADCSTSILWARGGYLSDMVGCLSINNVGGIRIYYDFTPNNSVTPSANWTLGATMTWIADSE